jgi:2-polyprenyl-6-methoxyphenol hydroxylase-like FAD-dependent oxidoreductase
MNILIVGAGPTGLTTGLELARRGIVPTIIERRENTSTLSRAVGITPRSLELLSHSGAAEPLIDESIAMDGLRVYYGQTLKLEMALHSQRTYHPNLICLPQDRTEAILAETLEKHNGSVHYGVTLMELKQLPNGVVARLKTGEEESEETFDQVVGADGIRSTVREQAGINYPGIDLEQTWSVADVDLKDWQHPGCLTVVQAGPNTVAVAVPIGESRYRLVASHDKALEAMPLKLNIENVRREGSFKISVRKAESYSNGRIHLAGDAAHCHSPVGGRGMNLGIADAVELAKRLVEGGLEGYTDARHGHALNARAVTERARKMSTGQNLFRRIAFKNMVTAARMFPPIQRKIGSFIVEF